MRPTIQPDLSWELSLVRRFILPMRPNGAYMFVPVQFHGVESVIWLDRCEEVFKCKWFFCR